MAGLIWKGGIAMAPLLLCSIFLIAVLLERRKSLAVLRMDLGPFKRRLRELLGARDVEGAVKLCKETPTPTAEVFVVGLERFQQLKALGRSDTAIESGVLKSMEDHAGQVVNRLERYLGALFVIGNVAPLLGFLGTVTGMIKCFKAIARTGGMRPDAIASGISEALIACATGLSIAIPAFVAYNLFSGRVKDFVVDLEVESSKLADILSTHADSKPDGPAVKS